MKTIIALIVFLFSTVSFTQTPNWTSVKETNISVGDYDGVDIFTNGTGNHIIVQESSTLKYYKMNVTGSAGTAVPLESNTSVVSPSISGDATRLFVVYRKSTEDYIRTKYSSDGGTNWSYISNLNYNASSIECAFSNNKLHITYQVSNVIYYSYYNTLNSTWSSQFTVSTYENGTSPRITAYNYEQNDLVYFMYKKYNSNDCKWRSYNFNTSSWGDLYTGFSISGIDAYTGFRVDGSNIVIYFIWHEQNPFQYYFAWVVRDLNNNFIRNGNADLSIVNWRMYSTPTVDGKTHTALYYVQLAEGYSDIGLWRSNDGASFPTDQFLEYLDHEEVRHLNLSSSSNDVHVIWKDAYGSNGGNNLRYKYDDQIPLAPQNLAVTGRDFGQWSHPVLTWSFNNEPDVYANDNGYEIQRRTRTVPGNFGNWSTIAYTDGDIKTYNDYEIIIEGTGTWYQAEYRIRAIDVGNNISDWSSTVSIYFGQFGKMNSGMQKYEYQLSQNHPNPFNPTTTIEYSVGSTGFVTLKVYDMLGTEVASLVNETQEAGSYSVEFNAYNLPSGIYVYTLTSSNFVATKKLLLLK